LVPALLGVARGVMSGTISDRTETRRAARPGGDDPRYHEVGVVCSCTVTPRRSNHSVNYCVATE